MLILCRHIQFYTLGRLSIDGFSFERGAQFNLEWIFSTLDSGFQSLIRFRILIAGFRIPKPRIPDSRSNMILTSLLLPIQSCSSKFRAWSCIASNFHKGWRGMTSTRTWTGYLRQNTVHCLKRAYQI